MRVFCFPNITHYQKKKSCGPVIVCNPGLELAAEIVTCGQIYRFQSVDQLKVLGVSCANAYATLFWLLLLVRASNDTRGAFVSVGCARYNQARCLSTVASDTAGEPAHRMNVLFTWSHLK
jgi:hypothetical protein